MAEHVEFLRSWARDIREAGAAVDADTLDAAADEIEHLRNIAKVARAFRGVVGRDMAELKAAQDAGMAGGLDTPRSAALKAAITEYDQEFERAAIPASKPSAQERSP